MDNQEFSLIFVPTWSCNCQCDHCFERIIPQTMTENLFQVFFTRLKEFSEYRQLRKIGVYWQGGEILAMPQRRVERGLEIGRRIFQDVETTMEHHLQTNLLLYDSYWKDMIAEYFTGTISSSLDFPNQYRRTSRLNNKDYNAVWIAKKNQAEADGFRVSVVTLPNPTTLELGAERFYGFFSEEVKTKDLQINFPFPGVKPDQPTTMDSEMLGKFLVSLFHLWVASGREINLNPFMEIENKMYKSRGRLPCIWAYSCGDSLLAVGPQGEVGQCDCWISTKKEFSFGNINEHSLEELLQSKKRELFLDRYTDLISDPECGECEFWRICYGGCPVRAYTFKGEMNSKDFYCGVYKQIFHAVVHRLDR